MAFGDRRTPLKRTGFTSKAPVNTERKPRTPLRQRSPKRAKQMRDQRAPEVKALVEAGATCQLGPRLTALGLEAPCIGTIGGLHERRKSGAGGSRENPANTIPACNPCNGHLEDMKEGSERTLVEAAGLVVREGSPEWHELGARAWRERA